MELHRRGASRIGAGVVMLRAVLIVLAVFAAIPAMAGQLRPIAQTGMCLGAGADIRPGFKRVGIAPCDGSENQEVRRGRQDTIFVGQFCLQAYIVDGQTDIEVMTAPCHGRDGQRWILTRDGRLSSGQDRCLTITGADASTRLLMNPCGKTPDEMRPQKWAVYGKFD